MASTSSSAAPTPTAGAQRTRRPPTSGGRPPAARARTRGRTRGRTSALREVLVHQLDGGGTFAGGCRDPLDGPVPHVAGREHSPQAGLPQPGGPAPRPPPRAGPVRQEVAAGEQEAALVELDRAAQPGRARLRADEHE